MPSRVDTKGDTWTLGAEWELSDFDTATPLPVGYYRTPDYTIVNSNGIAAQPDTRIYRYGGEINTPPYNTSWEMALGYKEVLSLIPNATINHRSNLHLHVRVPGLKDSLPHLKVLQEYIHKELPPILPLLEPIPEGVTPAQRKRARRRKVSHQTFLTPRRIKHQLAATTVQEFFEREVPLSKEGKVMWHAQPRVCVNLRQLRETDTIEFRHFPGTLSIQELQTCADWCTEFLLTAFCQESLRPIWKKWETTTFLGLSRNGGRARFPLFPVFDEEMEIGYQATAMHNGLPKAEVVRNINLILSGGFHGSPAYEKAKAAACGVSRKHQP